MEEKLPESIKNDWILLKNDLNRISNVKIPRDIGIKNFDTIQIIGFCDASKYAYACVIYIRHFTDKWKSNLIFAKSRIAPLKEISIPRMELLRAVIATRAINYVLKSLKHKNIKTILFSDSKCIIYWLRLQNKLSVFV